MEGLEVYLRSKFDLELPMSRDELKDLTREETEQRLLAALQEQYARKEEQIMPDHMRRLEKIILLNTIDSKWKDHLYAMDQLKGGVGLRSYGQRDPLIEFKREGYEMFQMMYGSISQQVAEIIFKVQPVAGYEQRRGVFDRVPQRMIHNEVSGFAAGADQPEEGPAAAVRPAERPAASRPVQSGAAKVGRNDPCPCGSGKKYKKCCGG